MTFHFPTFLGIGVTMVGGIDSFHFAHLSTGSYRVPATMEPRSITRRCANEVAVFSFVRRTTQFMDRRFDVYLFDF